MVRHDSRVADTRPPTRTFTDEARKTMGLAVQRAREAAGHPNRPSFSLLAGPPLGVRSLLKLESGRPVGAAVYEAAGRTLGLLLETWSEDTPLRILNGEPPPQNVRRVAGEDAAPAPDQVAEADAAPVEPDPTDYTSELEYQRAVYWYLRRGKGMSHEAVMRGFQLARAIFEEENRAERNAPNTSGEEVG